MNEYDSLLDGLRASGNFRTIPDGDDDASSAAEVVDFSSNDYLGIAADAHLLDEFMGQLQVRPKAFTSSASRLLAASQAEYTTLEHLLADLYGRSALLFNSGYHANTGLIPALVATPARTLIVADKLVHASIIDGMVLSKARFVRYRHNDYDHLERILKGNSAEYDRMLIVTEGVFSMDGDRCDVARLAQIKRSHPGAMLYIDEAHSFGVLGRQGLGLSRDAAPEDFAEVDVVVGTLGKAAASVGAFAVMSEQLRHVVVNRARSLIFSTSLPPVNVAWSHFVIEKILDMDSRRARLQRLAEILSPDMPRYIYPHIIGDAALTVETSHRLLREGMKVLPIRTPTVPPGTERLRVSLSAAMTAAQVSRLATALKSLKV